MLTLKNGTQVQIIRETSNLVIVEAVESQGFDSEGDHMFQRLNLSKKHHKGGLLLDGVSVI
ncbi:hypothetical protein NVP1161O_117 [Vibrio phage 1.161.O._10N.261.48.C5]|nr:hypothetical protein NVP1161O_117 [Vibrio phage 1.161.O._10N.261.48.C5]